MFLTKVGMGLLIVVGSAYALIFVSNATKRLHTNGWTEVIVPSKAKRVWLGDPDHCWILGEDNNLYAKMARKPQVVTVRNWILSDIPPTEMAFTKPGRKSRRWRCRVHMGAGRLQRGNCLRRYGNNC